jgi:hypothetical protein
MAALWTPLCDTDKYGKRCSEFVNPGLRRHLRLELPAQEIMAKNKDFKGRWIIPCPEVKVI